VTLCPINIFKMHFSHSQLKQSVLRLQGVSGVIKLVGEVTVKIVNPENEVSSSSPACCLRIKTFGFPVTWT